MRSVVSQKLVFGEQEQYSVTKTSQSPEQSSGTVSERSPPSVVADSGNVCLALKYLFSFKNERIR